MQIFRTSAIPSQHRARGTLLLGCLWVVALGSACSKNKCDGGAATENCAAPENGDSPAAAPSTPDTGPAPTTPDPAPAAPDPTATSPIATQQPGEPTAPEPTAPGPTASGPIGTAPEDTASPAPSATPPTGDAGGTGNADPEGDPRACVHALCDDFESFEAGVAPNGPWQVHAGDGSVRIDGTRYVSGDRAVRIEAPSNGQAYLSLSGAPVFPVANNTLYGRMMFFLEAAPQEQTNWNFIVGEGRVADGGHRAEYRYGGQYPIQVNGQFGGNRLKANYETPDSYAGTGPGSDCWHHATDADVVPAGRWACIEWKFTGPENRMELWIDGQAVSALTVNGRGQGCVNQGADFEWTAPQFESLQLGWRAFQPHSPITLYIDDVALGSERIGCPDGE